MIAEHRLYAVATCPIDEGIDVYEVVVTTGVLIAAEEILALVKKLTAIPIYQEDLTDALARELGAHVWTSGLHSGVRTVCQAGEAE